MNSLLYICGWTLFGLPTGYVLSEVVNDVYRPLYKTPKSISKFTKYSIIAFITGVTFLIGYTGNDLQTNICNCLNKK